MWHIFCLPTYLCLLHSLLQAFGILYLTGTRFSINFCIGFCSIYALVTQCAVYKEGAPHSLAVY